MHLCAIILCCVLENDDDCTVCSFLSSIPMHHTMPTARGTFPPPMIAQQKTPGNAGVFKPGLDIIE